ncbi:MAG: enoyl-CoA hydratase/isomerase family protein, partial [Alphaproteobacteria bacterium]|nr:enoyl-CoA hydratase/isomerase family protein [Alphaproteobacteria bacterium]
MSNLATTSIEDGIGILTINSPPVNALGAAVRVGINDGIKALASDASVKAIVLICGGRTFFAGADIAEFATGMKPPLLNEVLDTIENCPKPVVAAIHGTALGGGLETALCCHYRVAVPSAKLGLPEVKLGILPGAGGTQRLPRIIGPELAMQAMTSGQMIPAQMAAMGGVLDKLVDEADLRGGAIAFAREVVAGGKPLRRVRDDDSKVAPFKGNTEIFEAFLKQQAK